jgi:hypothetical protein
LSCKSNAMSSNPLRKSHIMYKIMLVAHIDERHMLASFAFVKEETKSGENQYSSTSDNEAYSEID